MGILDFSNAFDKVSHIRLSKKSQYYDIQGAAQWQINNFLNDRQQAVVDNATSITTPVTSGVLQGTRLGPTLFLIYINDISENITSSIRLFANDCVICRPVLCQQDREQLQRDLKTLVNWNDTWQKKCVRHHPVWHINKKEGLQPHHEGCTTRDSRPPSIFSVELEDNLKYSSHRDITCKKASSVFGIASQTLVRSKLEYATPIWKTQQKQIEWKKWQ